MSEPKAERGAGVLNSTPAMARRRVVRFVVLALLTVALVACRGARPGPPTNLPPPSLSTTVGPGDVFEVYVVGETNLPKEYRVQPDGTIDFPYLDRLQVSGLEPQVIVETIKAKLVEKKILSDPQVSLVVKQYNSKKISIIGQVAKPGSMPWTEGMKLVDAISQSGGFTNIADGNHVLLTRHTSSGKTVTAIVSVEAITDGAQADIPLQAGDTIKVDARVF
jgi:polysaccharide export outer membrane protein